MKILSLKLDDAIFEETEKLKTNLKMVLDLRVANRFRNVQSTSGQILL
ncbi:MAG: hypothetical protein JST67_04340 [Bacteroidetes bacterium]|nr:hypothetical protein [Bacteroidota bacterium]